jgi:outer membrane receptor for ferrienterochelin and colicins
VLALRPALIVAGLSIAAIASAQGAPEAELLELSLEELMQVEVTSATKSSLALREAPAIITVISAQEIEERGYQSVGEALESVAGFDLLHDHYQYNLGVRGVSPGARAWSRSVKVMIDGQPISFRPSQESWLGEELIPIEVVERIEIIKGPASALYGANAYLGVINVITKSGGQVELGRITALYGAGEHLADPGASAMFGGTSGALDVIGALRLRSPRLPGYRLVNVPQQSHPRDQVASESGWPLTGSGFAKLQLGSPELGRIALDVHYQQLERYTEFMDWGVLAHDNLQSLVNTYARLRYGHTFFEMLEWNVGVAVAHGAQRERDRLAIAPDFPTRVERSVSYVGYDVFSDLSAQLGQLARLSIGADYTVDDQELLTYYTMRQDGTRSLNPPLDTPTGGRSFSNVGVYLHGMLYPLAGSELGLLETLALIAGARLDHQNIYGDELNFSAGVVQQLSEHLYAKALYGTSYRAPSSNQLYSNFIAPNGTIGNPQLEPEHARTFELAFGGQVYKVISFELSGFYTQIENKVETRVPSVSLADNPLPQNLATIDSLGLEASLAVTAGAFKSYANYSFQRSRSEEPQTFRVRPDDTVTIDALLYPTHMLKMGANYKLPEAFLQGSLEARYIGARLGSEDNNQLFYGVLGSSTERYHLEPYVLLDLYVSSLNIELWKEHETRFGVRIANLLDEQYAYPGYRGFDVPGFARSFTLSASQEF